jgi:RHS repeat-associated protein
VGGFIMKVLNHIFCLVFVSLSLGTSAFAQIAEVQMSTERYADHGVHYGLPGWEPVSECDLNTGTLPSDGKFLHINLNPRGFENNISYSGTGYDEVTVTSNGRIYLGHLPDDYEIVDNVLGSVPFVDVTKNKLIPIAGSSTIGIRWQVLNTDKEYAIIDVGPFMISGCNHSFSYQVYFYKDGEIQFQPWIDLNGHAFEVYKGLYYRNSPLNIVMNAGEWFSPTVYNGAQLIESEYKKMYQSPVEKLLSNGVLRAGWIAKSFDNKNVVMTLQNDAMRVDFGTEKAAGGLIAYDNSREHPVVGSFNFISIEVKSINYGSGRTAENAVPVFFWYFGTDNGDLIENAHQANYPYFRDSEELEIYEKMYAINNFQDLGTNWKIEKKQMLSVSGEVRKSVIWPVAYTKSWKQVTEQSAIDYTKAIAFKFQTWDKALNRSIEIKNVEVGLRQPRSVQFLPPIVHKVSYEIDGLGYIKGVNFSGKLPQNFVDGSSIIAHVYPAPGDSISEIDFYNGVEYVPVYRLDGSQIPNSYVIPTSEGTFEINIPELTQDIHIIVRTKQCDNRVLDEVEPSYVRTEIFTNPSDETKKIESYTIKDGLGRYKVSATYFDDYGNVEFAPLSFVTENKDSFTFEPMHCKKCVIKSSNYYDGSDNIERQNALGFPYSKRDYHYGDDFGVTSELAGVAEASFALWEMPAQQWTIPIEKAEPSVFLSETQLTEKYLTEKYIATKQKIIDEEKPLEEWKDYNYSLVVNRTAEGHFTQQVFDASGNILYAWMKSGDSVTVSRTHYNSDNQIDVVDISVNGGPFAYAVKYTYDFAGRISSVESPDKGKVETKYNAKDQITFSQDARQRKLSAEKGKEYFSAIQYNSDGKILKSGEVRGGISFANPDNAVSDDFLYVLTENIYGKPTIEKLMSLHITDDTEMLQSILDEVEGVLPNEVGAIVSYDGSKVASDATIRANTLKMHSVNRFGKKTKAWTLYGIAGIPATRVSYSYNLVGAVSQVTSAEYTNGQWNDISSLDYSYDDYQRLQSISESGEDLMKINRTSTGIVDKTTYYDKGTVVYEKTYAKDIYGRTENISYKDFSGKNLYSEDVEYPSVVASRLSLAHHRWDGFSSKEQYKYDDVNRLIGFESSNNDIGQGFYSFDAVGRMIYKSENGSTIQYSYNNSSYQPKTMNVNGSGELDYLSYDASGNVWLDKRTRNAYMINALGLPDKAYRFSRSTTAINLSDVENGTIVGEEERTEMAYDENGNRIWMRTFGAGVDYERAIVPGIGEYSGSRTFNGGQINLSKIDLVGGAFRSGQDGLALFPVKDIQGSIRGYASKNGLEQAIGYLPYGTTVYLDDRFVDEGNRRWQGKEFDEEHEKYYFGARYYDPFFGMWMSPDPANQFSNPYSYGGDPINYIDPTGLWAIGLGLVVGWDNKSGWSFGVGIAADFGKVGANFSYTFNQDGSKSFNLGVNVNLAFQTFVYLEINMGLGLSMNSYSGTTLSTNGAVCIGEAGACGGIETGGSLYWDRGGSFMGATVYAGVYASFGEGMARVSAGYEAGLFGMEGRGLYAGASAGGLYAQYAQNGGWNYGFQESVYVAVGDDFGSTSANGKQKNVGFEMWIPSLGSFGRFSLGDTYDVSKQGLKNAQIEALLELAEKTGNVALANFVKENGVNLDKTQYDELKALIAVSAVMETRHPDYSSKYDKDVIIPNGYKGYPHIEFKYGENNFGHAFSSYNYGSNVASHLAIDFLGYYISRMVYDVND